MIVTFIKEKIIPNLRAKLRNVMPNDVISRVRFVEDPQPYCYDFSSHHSNMFPYNNPHTCRSDSRPRIIFTNDDIEFIPDCMDNRNHRLHSPMEFIREFFQMFHLELFTHNMAELEKYASLSSGIILADVQQMIEEYNSTYTGYDVKNYKTTISIDNIHFVEGDTVITKLSNSGTTQKYILKFKVTGRIEFKK